MKTKKLFLAPILCIICLSVTHNGKIFAQTAAAHNMTGEAYQDKFIELEGKGYQISQVSGYTINGKARFAAIWVKSNGPKPIARHNLTTPEFKKAFDDYYQRGYILKNISGYEINNRAYFTGVWEKNAGNTTWTADNNMTSSEYQAKFNELDRQHFKPSFITSYVVRGTVFFAAIWDKIPRNVVTHHKMTAGEFQNSMNDYVGKGYQIMNFTGYKTGAQEYYTGLWEKKQVPFTYARHGLSETNYQNNATNCQYQGYVPVFVNGYTQGNNARFNAIWRNSVMDGADLQALNDAVSQYMEKQKMNGFSYAVSLNGKLVFAKSHGFANSSTGEELSPLHRLRIMSISKAVTGLAIMRLMEQGKLTSLQRKVFGANSILGNKYAIPAKNKDLKEITVWQLLHHTAGLRSCNGETEFQTASSTKDEIMNMLINDSGLFIDEPGDASNYSNTGYYFLGAVIEALSGKTYEQYVREQVLDRARVSDFMRLGKADGTQLSGEAAYTPGSTPNLKQFGAFGGYVARPLDLLKLLSRADGARPASDIFTNNNTHDSLTTADPVSGTYACGWIINGTNQSHNGGYTGTRSWLAEIGGGYSVAIICNSEATLDAGGHPKMLEMLSKAVRNVSRFPSYDLFN
ncbi:serine hydrolase [Niabella hirudinis]|uniref:serine hydrolase n=1 Tax=Niabella hirudinis TaxID=1285929 RepID=UPI003EBBC3DE